MIWSCSSSSVFRWDVIILSRWKQQQLVEQVWLLFGNDFDQFSIFMCLTKKCWTDHYLSWNFPMLVSIFKIGFFLFWQQQQTKKVKNFFLSQFLEGIFQDELTDHIFTIFRHHRSKRKQLHIVSSLASVEITWCTCVKITKGWKN